MVKFRKEQQEILNYTGGIMAVPSVPGSGKTFVLTHLSLKLHKILPQEKNILLLTYMNSAVENFYTRLKTLDKDIKNIHIKTIHKFSLDLIKENFDLLNIPKDFSLISGIDYNKLTSELFKLWFLKNKENFSVFFKNNSYNPEFQDDFYINLKSTMLKFISAAKNYGLSSESIENNIKNLPDNRVLNLASSFYSAYQNRLKDLGCLDYDDLLFYAYKLLKNNENIRIRYQNYYEYILEDEAQDSNILQNRIVSLITNKNLIKVGDSNQNITGSFTLSSPRLFRNFCKKASVKKELTVSGRSSKNILTLANYFMKYVSLYHPCKNAHKALRAPFSVLPEEMPVKILKPQILEIRAYMAGEISDEFLLCIKKVKNFSKKFPEKTIGILCPRNNQVNSLAALLKKEGMEFEILNDYDENSSYTYKKLSDILGFIDKPNSIPLFIKILEEYLLKEKISEEFKNLIYKNGLENIFKENILDEKHQSCVDKLSHLLSFSLNTKEKFLIYIAQNFDFNSSEQELIGNVALNLKSIFKLNPKWSYADLIYELKQAENSKLNYFNWGNKKRTVSGKKIVLSTYHKSKGREWDMVYMLGVNEDFFPVFLHKEQFGEKSYLDQNYSILEAGVLYELEKIIKKDIDKNPVEEFKITRIEESLRILYVGITRAKEFLIISSNEENQGHFYYMLFSKLLKKIKD